MITYTTNEAYQIAKSKLDQYEEARLKYCKDHKTNGIPVEICNTFPFASEINNDVRSAIEIYEFTKNPPEKYFLYIDEDTKTATTWTGQNLGRVQFGRAYKSNFGDLRQPISIWAINGKTYFGIYYKSSGNYARVKVRK